jgi:hypothetical protein
MRDFTFYTSRPLTAKDCFDSLNQEIKNIRGTNSPDEVQISICGKWRSYLWFYNERFEDHIDFYESKEEFETEKKLIPIKDPYLNFFESYRSIDVKRVLKVLLRIYPELYVSADEDNPEWYGTAQEYIDTEFDY